MSQKKNFLEEGTFRNANGINKFLESVRKKGYSIELVALTVPKELSIAGIYKRFEEQKKTNAVNARFVKEDYHNLAFEGLPIRLNRLNINLTL